MIVYKYRPVDKYTLELLINNEFHLSNPKDFNDPFDSTFQPEFKASKEEILKWLSKDYILPLVKKDFLDKLERNNFNFGQFINPKKILNEVDLSLVYSFSLLNDETLLWSHYANSHKGIALGFETLRNTDCLEFDEKVNFTAPSVPPNLLPIFKVNYDIAPLPYNTFTNNSLKLWDYGLIKARCWAYEEEYRIIVVKNDLKRNKIKFSKKILKRVIFGVQTSDEDKETIHSIIKDKGYNVKFFQCHRKKDEYELEIVPE